MDIEVGLAFKAELADNKAKRSAILIEETNQASMKGLMISRENKDSLVSSYFKIKELHNNYLVDLEFVSSSVYAQGAKLFKDWNSKKEKREKKLEELKEGLESDLDNDFDCKYTIEEMLSILLIKKQKDYLADIDAEIEAERQQILQDIPFTEEEEDLLLN